MAGTIGLSLEIELAWGVNHLPETRRAERFSEERAKETETLERLLALCDRLDIQVSFNVVGHLLLECCSGNHGGPHATGWFEKDPGTDVDTHPLFYAPDLVWRIRGADVEHEICTHTFSHVPCHEATADVIEWELREARNRHGAFELPEPTSFVPPIHAPPSYDLLKRNGIRTIRLPTRFEPPVETKQPPNGTLSPVIWRLRRSHPAQVLFRTHPVRAPKIVDGVTVNYTTWHTSLTAPFLPAGQADPHPFYRTIPISVRQHLHKRYLSRGLQSAIKQDSYAHFWSHLFDLSNNAQWPPVRAFLTKIAEYRDKGLVNVVTMDSIFSERSHRAK